MGLNAVFIDTETGGLDPKENSLLSLGAVFVKNDETVAEMEWLIRPGGFGRSVYKVTPQALKVNGINLIEHDKNAISVSAAATQFLFKTQSIFGDERVKLGGHNTQFDIGFLKANFGAGAMMGAFSHRFIDTCSIADALCSAGLLPSGSTGSDSLLKVLGLSGYKRHTALDDARMARDFYFAMVKLIKGE